MLALGMRKKEKEQKIPVKRKKADLRSHLREEMDLQPKIPGKCKKVEIERVRDSLTKGKPFGSLKVI